MRKLQVISILLLALLQFPLFGQKQGVNYVSTLGSKIFIKEDAQYFSKFGAVKISSEDGKSRFIDILKKEVLYDELQHKMMVDLLLMQLKNLDCTKGYLIIVYSPQTNDIEIEQPFYKEGDKSALIYEVKKSGNEEKESYTSLRTYAYRADKLEFQHFFIQDKDKIELPVEVF